MAKRAPKLWQREGSLLRPPALIDGNPIRDGSVRVYWAPSQCDALTSTFTDFAGDEFSYYTDPNAFYAAISTVEAGDGDEINTYQPPEDWPAPRRQVRVPKVVRLHGLATDAVATHFNLDWDGSGPFVVRNGYSGHPQSTELTSTGRFGLEPPITTPVYYTLVSHFGLGRSLPRLEDLTILVPDANLTEYLEAYFAGDDDLVAEYLAYYQTRTVEAQDEADFLWTTDVLDIYFYYEGISHTLTDPDDPGQNYTVTAEVALEVEWMGQYLPYHPRWKALVFHCWAASAYNYNVDQVDLDIFGEPAYRAAHRQVLENFLDNAGLTDLGYELQAGSYDTIADMDGLNAAVIAAIEAHFDDSSLNVGG